MKQEHGDAAAVSDPLAPLKQGAVKDLHGHPCTGTRLFLRSILCLSDAIELKQSNIGNREDDLCLSMCISLAIWNFKSSGQDSSLRLCQKPGIRNTEPSWWIFFNQWESYASRLYARDQFSRADVMARSCQKSDATLPCSSDEFADGRRGDGPRTFFVSSNGTF